MGAGALSARLSPHYLMVLITGGLGFIGLHTARRILDAGEDVVLTRFQAHRQPSFLRGEVDGRLRVEPLDVADGWSLLEVLRRHHVTSIVHLAVPALGTAPAQEFESTIRSLVNVLEAARQQGVTRVSVASSLAVYANAGSGPWQEAMPLPVESATHTAAAKKAVEVLALHFADSTGLPVVLLRLAAIYGPLYHSMANLPSRLCHAAVRGGAPDLDGVRGGPPTLDAATDLCYVKDCAAGIQLVHMAGPLVYRTFNVGTGRATMNREVVAAVQKACPRFGVSLPSDAQLADTRSAYMDISRIREETGYEPAYDVESGVAEYVEWLRLNPQ